MGYSFQKVRAWYERVRWAYDPFVDFGKIVYESDAFFDPSWLCPQKRSGAKRADFWHANLLDDTSNQAFKKPCAIDLSPMINDEKQLKKYITFDALRLDSHMRYKDFELHKREQIRT